MSDETSDRTHYSSSKTNRKRASSAASGSRASHGAVSGSRKADDPAAWTGAPSRQNASERTHAFGKRVGW